MKLRTSRHAVAAVLMACTLGRSALADDTYVAPIEDAFGLAQKQYANGRFGEAFGNFFWAAIRDHAEAQELVGLMYLLGPQVYGPAVRGDRKEAQFWLGEAARRGRPAIRHAECAQAQAAKRVLAPALVMACLRS